MILGPGLELFETRAIAFPRPPGFVSFATEPGIIQGLKFAKLPRRDRSLVNIPADVSRRVPAPGKTTSTVGLIPIGTMVTPDSMSS